MDYKSHLARPRRLGSLLRWKHKKDYPFHFGHDLILSDDEAELEEDNNDFESPIAVDSCILSNELRVFVGTWNVAGRTPIGSLTEDLDDWLSTKNVADIYVLGFQEIVPLKARNVIGTEDASPASKWNSLIGRALNSKSGCPWLTPLVHKNASNGYHFMGISDSEHRTDKIKGQTKNQFEEPDGKYKLMASKKMVGVFISVWINHDLIKKYCISNVKVCSVACGIMGYLGNKGSVSVSMSIDGTSFCFVTAHLASGEKNGDELRRNSQVSEIFRRTCFPRLPDDDDNPHPLTILGHDRVFWLGDLNYRLCLEDSLARQLIEKEDWRGLQEFDQLRKEQQFGGVFQGWTEGNIEFAPTYKYSSLICNRYAGALPTKSGEKQRTPAWCDRILWYGKGVKQQAYFRTESKFSDHRPVSAIFSTRINVVPSNRSFSVTLPISLPAIAPSPQIGEETESEDKSKATLFSLLVKDITASPKQKMKSMKSLASSIGLNSTL